MNLKVKS
jgi:hypothetical protein